MAVDGAAFGSERATFEPWIAGLLLAPDEAVTVACARRGGLIVGVGYAIHATGPHGRSVGIGGIGVAPEARRAGIGAALTTWLVRRGFAAGAEFGPAGGWTTSARSASTRVWASSRPPALTCLSENRAVRATANSRGPGAAGHEGAPRRGPGAPPRR